LEEVFAILEIKASVRKAAEWALSQLTEADLSRPITSLWDGFNDVNEQPKPQSVVETLSRVKN
jgi:hypothetical protein